MKNIVIFINLSIIIIVTTIFTPSEKLTQDGSVNEAEKSAVLLPANVKSGVYSEFRTNSENSDERTVVSNATTEFVYEMAEARLTDLEEGKIAEQRSTSRALKNYGRLMVTDQQKMFDDLRKLGELKNISVSSRIGSDKADGLEDLKKLHGKRFDKKFIQMIIVDHKRDVKKFEKATHSKDADIQVFATKYLPVVQSHLDKIKALKKNN